MNASDTPRTDAVENDVLAEYRYCEHSHNTMAELARELECELAAMTKERDEWHDQVGTLVQQLFVAEQKISAVTKERDEWKAKVEANERDAERYRWTRENIDWLLSDQDGIAGCAYACQIDLQVIDVEPNKNLLDMIADFHLGAEKQS